MPKAIRASSPWSSASSSSHQEWFEQPCDYKIANCKDNLRLEDYSRKSLDKCVSVDSHQIELGGSHGHHELQIIVNWTNCDHEKKSGIGQPGRRVEGLSCGHSARLATGSVRASLCAGCFTSCTLTLIIAQCSVFTAVVPHAHSAWFWLGLAD